MEQPITCVYCGHTWSLSIAKLEEEKRVIYREGSKENSPQRSVEYLVTCPNCGRRLVVTVQVRGA